MTQAQSASSTGPNQAGANTASEGKITRIDFAFGAPHRLRTACQVAYKHYLAGRSLLVYSSQAETLQRFDRLLWSFEATAFVPHAYAPDAETAEVPVVLCSTPPLSEATRLFPRMPWLINLDDNCPPDFAQFDRILEIVSAQPEDRNTARERWRQYAGAGLTLKAHDLTASTKSRS